MNFDDMHKAIVKFLLQFRQWPATATALDNTISDTKSQRPEKNSAHVRHLEEHIKSNPPTSFLDLPRELRQTIIYMTYDLEGLYDPNDPHSSLSGSRHWRLVMSGYAFSMWLPSIKKVHVQVTEDVEYVEKKWKERYKALYREYDPCSVGFCFGDE